MSERPRAVDRETLEGEACDNIAWLAELNDPKNAEKCAARICQLDAAGLKMLAQHTKKALELLGE